MNSVFMSLIDRMKGDDLLDLGVIPWSSPVPFFGDAEKALVATLGLNPSNREFEDKDGEELKGYGRRFQTLRSLEISSWEDARIEHAEKVYRSCQNYFEINPYGQWFNALERIMEGIPASYYNRKKHTACHLDLVPYATFEKWGALSSNKKSMLVRTSVDPLISILKSTKIRLIILNGKSVVDYFELVSGVKLNQKIEPSFKLLRKSGKHVNGISYKGAFKELLGIDVGREVRVVGYNHNIQSSFGVTNLVRDSIKSYVSNEARGVLCEVTGKK